MDSELSPHDGSRKRKMDVKDVFNQDEDDNERMGAARKRKLVPLGMIKLLQSVISATTGYISIF